MRKFITILISLIVLVGAFVVYFHMQPKFGGLLNGKQSLDRFASIGGDNNTFVKAGTGAWVKQFDRDGQLYSQFKSDYYDPQPDGAVKVTHPVIQFFLSGSQVLQIEGVDGVIRFPPGTDKGVMSNSPTDPPRYGNLRHVTVKLFDSPAEQVRDAPNMTMTMTNAQFDNDTYRLFTQEYIDAGGKVIHADEIPVTIRAKDYSFDGSGLVMYWNDVDKQLKSLEIAHGTDLTIYNASEFSAQPTEPTQPTPPALAVPTTAAPAIQAAPAVQIAPATIPIAAPTTAPDAVVTRHRYQATFFDRVRVIQAGEELVRANRMDVDFITRSQDNSTSDNSTQDNSAQGNSAGGNSAGGNSTPSPTAPANPPPPATAPSPAPATNPATAAPSSQPVHIHWTGKMRMVPADEATAPPLVDGKAIIHFSGTPVLLHQTGADGHQWVDGQCDDLKYYTADSSAHLAGHVVLTQTKSDGLVSTVTGQSMDFSKLTHIAAFEGPGSATLPDPNDPQSILKARWQRSCRVHLYDIDNSQMQIERADLAGNVAVDHPRFHLTALDRVDLRFDKISISGEDAHKTSSPPLRQITAIGNADCLIHEANQRDREIAGQQLQLFRDPGPDGKLYAKTIICDGSVRAQQNDQTLTAEHLQIGLLPPPANEKPQAENDATLDKLIATTNVHVTGKDSSSASSNELYVQMVDSHPHVTLLGAPSRDAVVKSKTSTMTGPVIYLSPHDQTASIDGAGTFDGLQQPKDPSQTPRPLKLTWQKKATLDGKTNQVLVIGNVRAVSAAPGASRDSATCDRILATLVDVPPETNATKPPSTQAANSDAYGTDPDFLKNKQIKTISLLADETDSSATTRPDAQVESFLANSRGYLLHQYDLLSRRIDYESASKRLVVPGPGKIFAREQSPPTTRPSADNGSSIGGHGSTAIQWQKRFIYDDARNTAVIDGNVTIVHWSDGPKPQETQLDNADILQAEFEASNPPTTQADAANIDDTSGHRLKSLTATGAMTVRTTEKTIYCGEIEMDSAQQTLTCLGGELGKVTVVDVNHLDSGTCAEAIFNMKTNELKKMTNVTGQER
ncbi:MAG TPA: hypothetical protein VHX86_10420 [Tepidisphaeraceae bacterium]|jgi:lipopolysaccharide export system protein LptA|nr:hypothetical protein [Tepidisphaeraceae bacterium]